MLELLQILKSQAFDDEETRRANQIDSERKQIKQYVQVLASENGSELSNLRNNLETVFVNSFSDTGTETIKITEIAGFVVDLVPKKDQQFVMSVLVEMDNSASEISRYQMNELINALEK